ncbi:hypothetical protein ABN702_12885 [Bacillus haimaensis]|uniref:hypothetical protein n=1 Tax=Bacillus haimaensis TaxID=3160967 RepID=UPI003AA83502
MANEFGVSRALIVDVFEQLIAEGYLEGRQGSVRYVVELRGSKGQFPSQLQEIDSTGEATIAEPPAHFHGIDFRPSFPVLEQIPFKRWKETPIAAQILIQENLAMTMILQAIGTSHEYLSAFAAYQGDSVSAFTGDNNRRSDSSHSYVILFYFIFAITAQSVRKRS